MLRNLESSRSENLPNAAKIVNEVVYSPIHHGLADEDVDKVIDLLLDK